MTISSTPQIIWPVKITLQKSIEILTDLRDSSYCSAWKDEKDALTTALFIMKLLERGDFTYEPLSQ